MTSHSGQSEQPREQPDISPNVRLESQLAELLAIKPVETDGDIDSAAIVSEMREDRL